MSRYPKVQDLTIKLNEARRTLRHATEAWRIAQGLSWAEYVALLSEEVAATAGMFIHAAPDDQVDMVAFFDRRGEGA